MKLRHLAITMLVGLAGSAIMAAGCTSDADTNVPVRPAPPTRHQALNDALTDDAKAFAFKDGDWLEDLGDAPFYGLGWLSHRAASGTLDADGLARRDQAVAHATTLLQGNVLDGDIQDRVMAALGMIEHISASHDQSQLPVLDDYIDRLDSLTHTLGDYIEVGQDKSWALKTYGPTSITALIALVEAQYALLIGGPRAQDRLNRVIAIDNKIGDKAFGDLVDTPTGRQARGYAFAAGDPTLYDYPNIAMLLLKGRLFRLTKILDYQLEARAIYVALQPLKLADAPARYSSPYAIASLGINSRDLTTLSAQNYLTLALIVLFEITGDERFIDEADRMLDGAAAMRGPWCTGQVEDPNACAPVCTPAQACEATMCNPTRCTTGLLHHTVDGRLALPTDAALFCAGCNLQTLYVLGYRRMLANEPY